MSWLSFCYLIKLRKHISPSKKVTADALLYMRGLAIDLCTYLSTNYDPRSLVQTPPRFLSVAKFPQHPKHILATIETFLITLIDWAAQPTDQQTETCITKDMVIAGIRANPEISNLIYTIKGPVDIPSDIIRLIGEYACPHTQLMLSLACKSFAPLFPRPLTKLTCAQINAEYLKTYLTSNPTSNITLHHKDHITKLDVLVIKDKRKIQLVRHVVISSQRREHIIYTVPNPCPSRDLSMPPEYSTWLEDFLQGVSLVRVHGAGSPKLLKSWENRINCRCRCGCGHCLSLG